MFLKSKYSKSAIVICSLVLLFIVIVVYIFNPAKYLFYPKCMFHSLTGLYCPGCGALRAVHQLLHGRLKAALGYNPLFVVSLPFLAYGLTSELLAALNRKRLPRVFASPKWGWVLLGIVIAFWILRNIPVYPFTLLAP